ncbi:MAG: CHAT domain-containing protein, partial [Terriglobia bacterium]
VTIIVVPSMSTLTGHAALAKPQPPSLLLIGDPVSADANRFPYLVNARSEIEKIQAQFPSGRTVSLTGVSAEPGAYAAARPERFSFIHFAAHATANSQDPLDSAIILSPHQENFKLYARDVTHLPIRAELVTLSACRSAGARAYAGEGLVGFAWAFLRAGARDVIAGLWEVDDRSTGQLMTRLYASLRRGSSPAAALRDAQLEMLKSNSVFHKPYYWAPFEVFAHSLSTQTRASNATRPRIPSARESRCCGSTPEVHRQAAGAAP